MPTFSARSALQAENLTWGDSNGCIHSRCSFRRGFTAPALLCQHYFANTRLAALVCQHHFANHYHSFKMQFSPGPRSNSEPKQPTRRRGDGKSSSGRDITFSMSVCALHCAALRVRCACAASACAADAFVRTSVRAFFCEPFRRRRRMKNVAPA